MTLNITSTPYSFNGVLLSTPAVNVTNLAKSRARTTGKKLDAIHFVWAASELEHAPTPRLQEAAGLEIGEAYYMAEDLLEDRTPPTYEQHLMVDDNVVQLFELADAMKTGGYISVYCVWAVVSTGLLKGRAIEYLYGAESGLKLDRMQEVLELH